MKILIILNPIILLLVSSFVLLGCSCTSGNSSEVFAQQVFQKILANDIESYSHLMPTLSLLRLWGFSMPNQENERLIKLHRKRYITLQSAFKHFDIHRENCAIEKVTISSRKQNGLITALNILVVFVEYLTPASASWIADTKTTAQKIRRFSMQLESCIQTKDRWFLGEGIKDFQEVSTENF